MRPMSAVLLSFVLLSFVLLMPELASSAASARGGQSMPDLAALARQVRETLRREYSTPLRFTYIEKRRDVDISLLGKVSVGPLRTFEVFPRASADDYKRLIAIDGKPLDPAELARRDEKHRRDVQRQEERERTESPQRRAERLRRIAEEARERDAVLDDAAAAFDLAYAGREVFAGDPVLVVTLKPRPQARVTTREGEWMKKSEGRMWISENGNHIARLRIYAVEDLSIGWGVVAHVDSGSGFDYVRKRIGDAWVPLELTIEGSGRTLLFRRFRVKTVTTYSDHQLQRETARSESR
jgi:hypothetical protein